MGQNLLAVAGSRIGNSNRCYTRLSFFSTSHAGSITVEASLPTNDRVAQPLRCPDRINRFRHCCLIHLLMFCDKLGAFWVSLWQTKRCLSLRWMVRWKDGWPSLVSWGVHVLLTCEPRSCGVSQSTRCIAWCPGWCSSSEDLEHHSHSTLSCPAPPATAPCDCDIYMACHHQGHNADHYDSQVHHLSLLQSLTFHYQGHRPSVVTTEVTVHHLSLSRSQSITFHYQGHSPSLVNIKVIFHHLSLLRSQSIVCHY